MKHISGATQGFLDVVSAAELLVCLTVAVLLALRWRRQRSQATGNAVGVFGVVAFVIVTSFWTVDPAGSTAARVWTDVVLCLLLTMPYLLVRFTHVLGGLGDRAHQAMGLLLVVECVTTVSLPPLPKAGAPQPSWVAAYTAFILAAWGVQSVLAARGLWRAGRGQASVVRHRMRSLSAGAVLLAATLVVSGATGQNSSSAVRISVALLGLVSILLFALAFLLPPSLRLVWRQADLTALAAAERGLMTALSQQEVAATIVPVLGTVLGGGGAALLDKEGEVLRATGLTADQQAQLGGLVRAGGPTTGDVLVSRLSRGWLVVQAGRLAPVFGDDEAAILSRVATMVDLALQRVRLFEQERASREAAEAASAELETLLYSVSHDLRSPLISVLGYLDVLQQEHAAQLTTEGAHYLERITVNATYMQSLISDLLELSRIGRTDTPHARLSLQVLADQVAEGASLAAPAARVAVEGPLPVVRINEVRARQLLTNLVDNALKHGGRDDLTVTISAATGPAGELLLRVSDDGRGIPVEYRTRVLQVFERLDAPKSSPGTGMGLAICKRIAETLGGSIVIQGPPPGRPSGTTVEVTLPSGVVFDQLVPVPRDRPDETVRTPVEETA